MINYRTLKDKQLKKMTKCCLVEQGFTTGSCMTRIKDRNRKACDVTLKQEGKWWHRLIKSAHLSRPEHYFSIYQSGCNHSCLKCHSWAFSQKASGRWISAPEIGLMAKEYEKEVDAQTQLPESGGTRVLTVEDIKSTLIRNAQYPEIQRMLDHPG